MKPTFKDYLMKPDTEQDSYYSEKPRYPAWIIDIAQSVNTLHDPKADLPLTNDAKMLKDIQHLVTIDRMDHNQPDRIASEYLKQRRLDYKELSQELLGM